MLDSRPLLFLDIDGPLIPFGTLRLDPALGPLLRALPCQLVWATTWTHEANRSISPVLGLSPLPVVDWPDRSDTRIDTWFGLHWKTRTLVEWAAGRPFIWVDDELGDNDREWVSAHHRDAALLYRVEARIGLVRGDVAVFGDWLDAVSGS
ncbi:HAD domain-containing protein [Nocardia sp. NPDC004722]